MFDWYMQGLCQGFYLKDQDKDKDSSVKDKDKDQDLNLVLKESLRTRTKDKDNITDLRQCFFHTGIVIMTAQDLRHPCG